MGTRRILILSIFPLQKNPPRLPTNGAKNLHNAINAIPVRMDMNNPRLAKTRIFDLRAFCCITCRTMEIAPEKNPNNDPKTAHPTITHRNSDEGLGSNCPSIHVAKISRDERKEIHAKTTDDVFIG